MTTVTHRRLSVDSTRPQPPAASWLAWTDRHVWTLTDPTEVSALEAAGTERLTDAWPNRYTPESFARVAAIVARTC
jgi:hypothetical protein